VTFNIMEGGAILFDEESPSQNPLGLEFVVSQVLMIRVNMDLLTTVQHGIRSLGVTFRTVSNQNYGIQYVFPCNDLSEFSHSHINNIHTRGLG
jgi:hypothetical protein